MARRLCFALWISLAASAADTPTTPQLLEMARHHSQGLDEALRTALGDDKIKKGTAFAGEGPDFIFAFESETQPALFVDDQPAQPMTRAANLWLQTATLRPGTVHGFYYVVNGVRTGG